MISTHSPTLSLDLNTYVVLGGPDKSHIVLALLNGAMDRPKTVIFKVQDGDSFDPLDVAIDSISRHDDGGDLWIIEGRCTVSNRCRGASCLISYNTRSRSGTLKFSI